MTTTSVNDDVSTPLEDSSLSNDFGSTNDEDYLDKIGSDMSQVSLLASIDDYDDEIDYEGRTPFIDDILTVIFSFLKTSELYIQGAVSRQFRRVSNSNGIWLKRVKEFQLPPTFERRRSIKRTIVRAGKKSNMTYREIYHVIQNPFGQSKMYLMKLNKYKECDTAGDIFQFIFPFVCFLILIFVLFLIIIDMKELAKDYPIRMIGSGVSIGLCIVFLLLEVSYILRVLFYKKVGQTSNNYQKFQNKFELGQTEKRLIFYDYFHFYQRYHEYTGILVKVWGDYGMYKSLPILITIFFWYDTLYKYGLLMYIVGLTTGFYCFSNFLRFMILNKLWKNCIFDPVFKNDRRSFTYGFRAYHYWRGYSYLADFFCSSVSGISLYLQFYIFVCSERGSFEGSLYERLYIYLPVIFNFLVASLFYNIALVHGIFIDLKEDWADFHIEDEFGEDERVWKCISETSLFLNFFIRKMVEVSMDYIPHILTPSMMFVLFMYHRSIFWIWFVIPLVTVCFWGLPMGMKNLAYGFNKLLTLCTDFDQN